MTTHHYQINVFLSYAHEDEAWLQQFVTHLSLLQRRGVISTWYDRQIVAGTIWSNVIDQRLEQASLILLLVSADFLASDYCYEVEMKRALKLHESGRARVIPIVVRPADWKDAPFAHLQALPTNAKAISSWKDRDEAWVDVVAGIRKAIKDMLPLGASTSLIGSSPVWNVPYARNPFFIGRDELLTHLHNQLLAGQVSALSQPQAISGLGGIGKTQIAVEYAYRHKQDYQAILWVHAENRETLNASYNEIADLLTLPERESKKQNMVIQGVKTWMQTHQSWLLIFDNVDEPEALVPFLPTPIRGHLLVTTRASDVSDLGLGFGHVLAVETFSPELGTLFLLHRAGLLALDATLDLATLTERTQAQQIGHDLGWLPLALDQAGAYIRATRSDLASFRQIYQQHRAQLLRERRGRDHPEPVATTWSLSFQRIEEENPAAADLLRACAFLASDEIPEEILLRQGAQNWSNALAKVADDLFLWNDTIYELLKYSLIQRNPRNQTLSIHRLVQVVLQDAMEAPTQRQWVEHTVQAVSRAFPERIEESAIWPTYKYLLPHANVCVELIVHHNLASKDAIYLREQIYMYLSRTFQQLEELLFGRKELHSRLEELHSRLKELHSRLKELHSRKVELLSRKEELLSRLKKLHSRLKELHSRLKELHSRKEGLLSRTEEFSKEEFETAKQEYETVDQEYETVNQEYETVEEKFKAANQEYETVNQEYETVNQEYETAEEKFKAAEKEDETVKQDFEEKEEWSKIFFKRDSSTYESNC